MKIFRAPVYGFPLILLIGSPVSVLASDERFSVPGTACGAFVNAQADKLERQQARIFNPVTNGKSLWVICPVQTPVLSNSDDSGSDDNPSSNDDFWDSITGWVNVLWASGTLPGSKTDCVIRQYSHSNTHIPGVSQNGVMSVSTISSSFDPGTLAPYVDSRPFSLPSPSNGWDYVTVSCLLSPGAGVNSIDFHFDESSS